MCFLLEIIFHMTHLIDVILHDYIQAGDFSFDFFNFRFTIFKKRTDNKMSVLNFR